MKRYDFDLTVYERLYYQEKSQRSIANEVGCSSSTISSRHKDFEQIHVLINLLSPNASQLMNILKSSVLKSYADVNLCELMVSYVTSKNWINSKKE